MTISKFEDIIAWRKAGQLTTEIYKKFSSNKDFGFRDQIQRASVSIMNNIAEGFERASNKELKYFLYIAKGSCGEVTACCAGSSRGRISHRFPSSRNCGAKSIC